MGLGAQNGKLSGAEDVDSLSRGSSIAGLAVTTTLAGIVGVAASVATASLGTVRRRRGESGSNLKEHLLLLGLGADSLGLGGSDKRFLLLLVKSVRGLPLALVSALVGLAELLLGLELGSLDLQVLEILLQSDGGVNLLNGGSLFSSSLFGVSLGNGLANGLVFSLLLVVTPTLVDSLLSVNLAGLGVSVRTRVLLASVGRGGTLSGLGAVGGAAIVAVLEGSLRARGLLVVLAGSRAGSTRDGGSRLCLRGNLLHDGSGLTIITYRIR